MFFCWTSSRRRSRSWCWDFSAWFSVAIFVSWDSTCRRRTCTSSRGPTNWQQRGTHCDTQPRRRCSTTSRRPLFLARELSSYDHKPNGVDQTQTSRREDLSRSLKKLFWKRIPVVIVSFLRLDHRLSPQGSDLTFYKLYMRTQRYCSFIRYGFNSTRWPTVSRHLLSSCWDVWENRQTDIQTRWSQYLAPLVRAWGQSNCGSLYNSNNFNKFCSFSFLFCIISVSLANWKPVICLHLVICSIYI